MSFKLRVSDWCKRILHPLCTHAARIPGSSNRCPTCRREVPRMLACERLGLCQTSASARKKSFNLWEFIRGIPAYLGGALIKGGFFAVGAIFLIGTSLDDFRHWLWKKRGSRPGLAWFMRMFGHRRAEKDLSKGSSSYYSADEQRIIPLTD